MSDLSFLEKNKLEKRLGMSSGYVASFSNRTFQEFVADSVGKNIYDDKYLSGGGSKANVLRTFWKVEPNHVVGKLLADMLELIGKGPNGDADTLHDECCRVAQRLRSGAAISNIEELDPQEDEATFQKLVKSVKHSIDANEPETGLDRLHTYATKFLRIICEKRGIAVPRDKPLHSLLGEYIKKLEGEGLIESEMSVRILKSSISVMESFSHVRNQKSLAHDNEILNYDESVLIFNHVVNSLVYIQGIEKRCPPQS